MFQLLPIDLIFPKKSAVQRADCFKQNFTLKASQSAADVFSNSIIPQGILKIYLNKHS